MWPNILWRFSPTPPLTQSHPLCATANPLLTDGSGDAIIHAGVMGHMMEGDRERRKHPRFEASLPISFRVSGFTPMVSESEGIKGIGTRTMGRVGNISLEGLLIEANPTQAQVSEIIRAKQGHDRFDIEIETTMIGENVKMIGKVVWYDINFIEEAPYLFRAGIFLGEMDRATRRIWERLIVKARS